MVIDVSPDIEAQLKAKAQSQGLSVGAYVEHLVFEEESRCTRLFAFRQTIDERLRALNDGEGVDGEEVMAQLIAELDAPGQVLGTR